MKTTHPRRDYGPSLQEVLQKGKGADWQKPASSFCCGAVCWWHGWRERWCGQERIWVRRVVCSSCRRGFTHSPQELWPRFQAPSDQIAEACEKRLLDDQWTPGFSRSRIRWWVRVALRLISLFKNLFRGIQKMLDRFPWKAPLSRFWLTHQRVS